MKELIEKNHVSLLSHIIYTIYNTENEKQMRKEVLELLKYAIPFDTANFFLVESDADYKYALTDLVNVNSLKNADVDSVLKKYMEECSVIDSTHWLCNAKKAIAYRTTDFLSESALENTDYYKEMFIPYNLHYGAQVVFAHEDICLGVLTLFRSKESTNFSDTEIFYLDNLKEHLSIRLYQARIQNKAHDYSAALYMEKYQLTRRECEILDLLFQGLSNEQIALRLYISENTLRRHIYNLFNKLNIKHRWELFFIK